MKFLHRLWAHILIAVWRLRSQGGLTLAASLGLTVLLGLVMSIPSYADAVSYRLLSANLAGRSSASATAEAQRAPFTFLFEYTGPFRGASQWEQAQAVDAYLLRQASAELGLPQQNSSRILISFPFKLSILPEANPEEEPQSGFAWVNFAAMNDLQSHITLVEGSYPEISNPATDPFVEVLISEKSANQMGLSAGETYTLYSKGESGITLYPVRLAGIWRATDPKDSYWFYSPREFDKALLVPEATFLEGLAPAMLDELGKITWRLTLDSSNVHAVDAIPLANRITRVELQAKKLFTGVYLKESPQALLLEYQRTTSLLSFLLAAFSVPIAALFLAYINLVSGVIIERQRNEIAVLRSRGATLFQIAGITTLEGLLMVALALATGVPLSLGVIWLMGKTRSFLDFSLPASLRLHPTELSLVFGGCTAVLILMARLALIIEAARHTIITYKQEQARNLRPPWWQRAGLDLLLFIPAAYGAFLLRSQGSILPTPAVPTATAVGSAADAGAAAARAAALNDPFQNPLLMLAPALGIFAFTLFMLRLLPGLMAGISWAAAQSKSVGLLLAARHLSRSPSFYSAPLILLVLTLSLSTFTASLAQTLDQHFYDLQYYQQGADIRLVELGQCLKFDPVGNCDTGASTEEGATWAFIPVAEHLKAPGVTAAARVGSWPARASMSGKPITGAFLGIDRLDFSQVAFWRKDFAADSLGELMNALASDASGVLAARSFLKQEVLYPGDSLALTVDIAGKSYPIQFTIVGSFDLFPTWYPEKGPLFVGNLDYLFEQVQGQHPYNVWLKTEATPCEPLVEALTNPQTLALNVVGCISTRQGILQEQKRPEHQGVFGLLSVGFAGAGLLTVLGFLLYALFSFQRRMIEMGVLRALGLSSRQMRSFLAWELIFLIAIGLVVGSGLGIFVSLLFIPYLQLGSKASALIPPFTVQIAWERILQIYALFGLLFVAAFSGLARRLAHLKIFQAVKLGETT